MTPIATILALDFGTSAVKAASVTIEGRVLSTATATYPTRRSQPLWAEQDPLDWWQAGAKAARQCLGAAPQAVAALALTGQMQDLIALDEAGHPIGSALLYSDLRASTDYTDLADELPNWDQATGNQQDAASVTAKLRWLLRHRPDDARRARKLVFGPAAFIGQQLTGRAVCDFVTASTTGLLDQGATAWWQPAISAAGFDPAVLPDLLGDDDPEASLIGITGPTAAVFDLPAGIPVIAALGDAGSATDGLVGTEPGASYVYLGTTGWYAKVVADDAPALAGSPYRLLLPGARSVIAIGGVLAAGNAADWARRTFMDSMPFAAADKAAAARYTTPDRPQILALPAIAGERSPVRAPEARAAFIGADEATLPVDFYLATLTGVAMNLAHVADDLGGHSEMLPAVGGAASPLWSQILADVFNTPVAKIPAGTEAGTHSAARTAARYLNWPSIPPINATETVEVTDPSPLAPVLARLKPAHRGLYQALEPTFHSLSVVRQPADQDHRITTERHQGND